MVVVGSSSSSSGSSGSGSGSSSGNSGSGGGQSTTMVDDFGDPVGGNSMNTTLPRQQQPANIDPSMSDAFAMFDRLNNS